MSKPLPFDVRHGIARDLVRRAIREQLQCSTSLDEFFHKTVSEEILASLTRPALGDALIILGVAVGADPRQP